MKEQRDYYFDNLKAVLIFLVVLGHFLLPIRDNQFLVSLKRLIYIFHMPLFVFVSGYFAKNIYKNHQFNFKKILFFIKTYVLFVILIQIVYQLFHYRSFSEINFIEQSGAPWYLFAMIVWYLLIPLVRKFKPAYVITVNIVLALTAGYIQNIGDFLCLSRIVVFGPFFFAGYFVKKETLEKALNIKFMIPVCIPAVSICGAVLTYGELDNYYLGAVVRFLLMIAAFILSWAMMFFVPKQKTSISIIGARTLPLYILHRIIRDVLNFCGLYTYLESINDIFIIPLLLCLSISLTYYLTTDPVTQVVNSVTRIRFLNKKPINKAYSNNKS